MQILINFFKSVVLACPYSIIGSKCINIVNGKSGIKKNSNNKMLSLKNGIKMGRNISLVGVFCPFLWFSIILGASKDFIILNLIHSGIFVAIGFLIIIINYVALASYKKT